MQPPRLFAAAPPPPQIYRALAPRAARIAQTRRRQTLASSGGPGRESLSPAAMVPYALLPLISSAISGVAAMASTPTNDYVTVQSEYLVRLEEQLTSAVPTVLQPALNNLLNAFDMADDFELLPHLRLNLKALRLTYTGKRARSA
eukprot:4312273-Pleurochrysis_carterae.AAC.4